MPILHQVMTEQSSFRARISRQKLASRLWFSTSSPAISNSPSILMNFHCRHDMMRRKVSPGHIKNTSAMKIISGHCQYHLIANEFSLRIYRQVRCYGFSYSTSNYHTPITPRFQFPKEMNVIAFILARL